MLALVEQPKVRSRRFSDTEIAEALRKSHGLVTPAAESLGISVQTIYTRLKKSKSVAKAMEQARNATLDRAESKLFDAVEAGDQWAIQFVLKTLGKSRGYTERTEIAGTPEQPIVIRLHRIDSRKDKS